MSSAFLRARGVRVFAVAAVLVSGLAVAGSAAHASVTATGTQSSRGAVTTGAATVTKTLTASIEPTFTAPSAGSSADEWTTVNTAFPDRSYWDTAGLLQVGDQTRTRPHSVGRSFVSLPVPPQIYGATIITAQLNLTEESSASCNPTPMQAWSTGPISPSTTWNNQPAWKSEADSQTIAHGYNSSCPAAGVGFNVKSALQSAANQKSSRATFGLRAGNESSPTGWKQFANTATLSITYDHAPSTPTGLSTSPVTSCPASTPTTVGDGDVSLNVPASDPDGGSLGVTIDMWNTATGAAFTGTPTDPQQLTVSSGSAAVFIAHQADLEAAAAWAITEFSWKAKVTDFDESSPWSATCSFYFDPTHPGTPVVTAPATATIGQPATFTVAPPASGPVPAAYSYQLNAGPPVTVAASSTGAASITLVPTRAANTLTVSSGSTAVFIAHQADLEAAAAGAVTEFSWKARVTDFDESSPWSATCSFYFDPTHPGAPVVTAPATATIGQPATFTVAPPASGPVPARYSYQLDAGGPATVTASSSGDASITLVPTRAANTLTVTSLSPGGNAGGTTTVEFNASPAPTAADADLTGDGIADLLTVGSSANGLPPGLWLAAGVGNGQVTTAATDIGGYGNGSSGDDSPADFTGAQVITGHFGGTGLQDVLAYYPSGPSAGQANILFGNGNGTPIQAQISGNAQTLSAGLLSDLNGDNPLQLANAGNTSGDGNAYPDLIAINGDSSNGYYLEFYPDSDGTGSYFQTDPLTTLTPTGGTDWNNWTMATAQLSSGTAMYLWDASTGALYLWENLAYNINTGAFTYTQYVIANGSTTTWNKGATLTLQAADVNGDGTPDLWAVGAGATVTAYLATLGSGTATLAPQPAQTLTP